MKSEARMATTRHSWKSSEYQGRNEYSQQVWESGCAFCDTRKIETERFAGSTAYMVSYRKGGQETPRAPKCAAHVAPRRVVEVEDRKVCACCGKYEWACDERLSRFYAAEAAAK